MAKPTSKTYQKIIILIWLGIVALFSVLVLFWTWNENIFDVVAVKDKLMIKTFTYAFFGGVLGSVIYALRGFYQSVAERNGSKKAFDFRWIYWYLIRPFAGGIFGFVIYCFTRAELISFGLTQKTSEQNNLMFFSISFLAGFGFHDFAEYLTKKLKILFGNNN